MSLSAGSVTREVVVPGGEGRAIEVSAGEYISIIDLEGQQVADFVAVARDDLQRFVSASQTRLILGRFSLRVGDRLVSQFGEPMFELVYDDAGTHDLLVSSCSPAMYRQRFGVAEHRSCRENLTNALAPYGVEPWYLPDPVNLFMNVSPQPDGTYRTSPGAASAGERVVFRCLVSAVVAISACPFDLGPLNGDAITPVKVVVGRDVL